MKAVVVYFYIACSDFKKNTKSLRGNSRGPRIAPVAYLRYRKQDTMFTGTLSRQKMLLGME
jgi:hypothetical protein